MHPTYDGTEDNAGFWFVPGVRIVKRCLHCLHVESRVSRKWSLAILLIITFSVWQTGQVNRITYPVLVPITSGFKECFIIVSFIFMVVLSDWNKNAIWFFDRFVQTKKVLFGMWKGRRYRSIPVGAVVYPKPFMVNVVLAV